MGGRGALRRRLLGYRGTADWQAGGLQIPAALNKQILDASLAFGRAVTRDPCEEAAQQAQTVLEAGYRSADQLVQLYTEQMFNARHQRQPRLDTTLGCRLGAIDLQQAHADSLMHACNSIGLTFAWRDIRCNESKIYNLRSERYNRT